MLELIKRDLKIYYRDKATVFFSLLTVIITISLYVLFLAELQVDTIESAMEGYPINDKNLAWIVNTWITAGLLSIIPVTSSLATIAVMVQDREKKIMMDFKSMPMKAYKYPMAVIISATIIGTIMGLIAFEGYSLFIIFKTNEFFTISQVLKTVFLIILTALFSSTFFGWVATLFKTSSGFTSLNVVIGTIIGFINAVYVPMGVLPEYIQKVLKFIPTGHLAVLFRNVIMKDALEAMFKNAPKSAYLKYCKMYCINFYDANDEVISHNISYVMIVALIFISFALFNVLFSRKEKEY